MKTQMDDTKNETANGAREPRRGRLRSLVRDTRGLNTVEYAILLALIVVVAFGAWQSFGEEIKAGVDDANEQVDISDKH